MLPAKRKPRATRSAIPVATILWVRILYSFPHRLGDPGIGTTAAEQVRGLVDGGHDVSVYSMSAALSPEGTSRHINTMAIGRRRIPRRFLGFDRALAYHDWTVARMIHSNPGAFDAVHCWGLASARTLAVARALGVHSFREATNAHTAVSYELASSEAAKLGVTMPRWHSHVPNPRRLSLEEREFALAETILVPSDYARQTFLDRGVPAPKLVRHQYGFDPAMFPDRSDVEEADMARPLRACFVGSGEPRKGLHYALEAWIASGLASRGEFVVCGRLIPDYERKLARLLGHPSIQRVGFTTDVGAVMRNADLFLLPSVEEGSALVTYEAQASGCVMLVSAAAGALLSPDSALVHDPGDVDTLTEHLRRVDSDRGLLARLRAATRAQRERLTWAAAADRLDEIYAERVVVRTAGPASRNNF